LTSMVVHGPVSSLRVTQDRLEMPLSQNLVAEQLRYHIHQGLWALREAHILTQSFLVAKTALATIYLICGFLGRTVHLLLNQVNNGAALAMEIYRQA
jgi:hypothetical protein